MAVTLGSPPPMRGKAGIYKLYVAFAGITPAYAGKRLLEFFVDHLDEDHPRLCGEKFCGVD